MDKKEPKFIVLHKDEEHSEPSRIDRQQVSLYKVKQTKKEEKAHWSVEEIANGFLKPKQEVQEEDPAKEEQVGEEQEEKPKEVDDFGSIHSCILSSTHNCVFIFDEENTFRFDLPT